MRDELLTIGRFARLCRLSVKQLRHYDELGLLTPAHVDPHSGYRNYSRAQARDALTIALLRDADVPLPAIAEIVRSAAAERSALLRAEGERLAARIERDRERLRLLERLALDAPYDVSRTVAPALALMSVEDVCDPDGIGEAAGALVGRLLSAAEGWRPPVVGLFPLDVREGMRVAVGVEALSPNLRLPETDAVTTRHHGPYAELPLAYHALLSWIGDRGLAPRAPVRELYLVAPGEAGPEELITDIVIPVEEPK
ncbi:MerR family transcriptional regulator [Phytomonospora sp. NPDC050363]|uniref:MerR family transcriptional regulator n=1 Tax=Phytomonospora sp. NPDC050363 TaxID=3155642 RepID=UPI0033DCCBED